MCDETWRKERSSLAAQGMGTGASAVLLVTSWGISLKLERCLGGGESKINKGTLSRDETSSVLTWLIGDMRAAGVGDTGVSSALSICFLGHGCALHLFTV